MEVVCIDDSDISGITVGKVYSVVKVEKGLLDGDYFIVNDFGRARFLRIKRFIPLFEWRENKINNILL